MNASPDVLPKLEKLKELVTEYIPIMYSGEEKHCRALHDQIAQIYGEVEEVYRSIVGDRRVPVEKSWFFTYFEAGFLSGRTYHVSEGRNELLKVIGRVKTLGPAGPLRPEENTTSRVRQILGRFRECCRYVTEPPKSETEVQELLWTMLRAQFDDLIREESLPKFGNKSYVPDFGLPSSGLLIEAKFVGPATQVSRMQDELLADVHAYIAAGQTYKKIIAFVYDAAHKLRDPAKFKADLCSVDGMVDVIVIPGIG